MIFRVTKSTVLDACVLYPAPVRDLLLHLATQKIITVKWSEQIHHEWVRNLSLNRPDIKKESLVNTVQAMNKAFPDANVTGFEELIDQLILPDPDDRHVLAVAIKSAATQLITFNLKDFPNSYLTKFGITALHPDYFIENLLEQQKSEVLKAFKNQVSLLKNPPLTAVQVLESLEKCGLPKSVAKLEKLISAK